MPGGRVGSRQFLQGVIVPHAEAVDPGQQAQYPAELRIEEAVDYRLIDLPQIDPLQEDLAVIRVDILKILVAFYCEALAPYRFDRIRHGHGQVGQFPDERKSSTTTKPARW